MSDIDTLSRRTASAIGRALAAGETSPVALTEYYLEKMDAPEARDVYIAPLRERALEMARAAEARIEEGRPASALDGVPVVLKDLIDLAGERTTAGSETRRDAAPAEEDAPCAAHLAAAGMVFLGKVNLTEFAYSGLGLNPHFGTPRNPFSPGAGRIPGGSSSGSGVAVAANLAPCAIGTDTGGSVRIPSAFNGLVGLKTSEGRIDKRGVFPLSETLDTVGPMARSVEDCVLLDMALRGAPASAVRRGAPGAISVFVPETVALDDLDGAVAKNFETSLKRLERAGAEIERGPLPILAEIMDTTAEYGTLSAPEAYRVHKALVDGPDSGRVDPRVMARILPGREMSAHSLLMIQAARRRLRTACEAFLGDRFLAMPTVAMTAPETAPLDADPDLYHRTNLKALRNTNLGNFLNLCGLAMPNGADPEGLPTSFLLCAPGGSDDRLLSYGMGIEPLIREAQS